MLFKRTQTFRTELEENVLVAIVQLDENGSIAIVITAASFGSFSFQQELAEVG